MNINKNISDEEIVKLFITTQKNKYFEVIYDRFAEKIYRKCYSFVKNSAKAEDFMHDIFLKLILNLGAFQEDAKFSTWIYSIAYNHCIDHIRESKKLQEVSLEGDFEDDTDPNFEEMKSMEAKRLSKALDKISVEEKSLILMKYQDDMSIKEIGDVLHLSESAVKMRLKRTKEKVKSIYFTNLIFWGILLSKIILLIKSR